jgi:GTP diphosphokinase / guanosine-3',5'-bis(diphosphate) 3'-diphosphatase
VDTLKTDVFQDRVYAFTPKGKLVDLPAGSTPIDFAYQVHTQIGDRCRGARVNGKLVGLDYQLKTGDQVEVLTAKRGGPSRDWLNPHLGYVKTQRARTKIRQWFKRQNREQNIADGRAVLEKEIKRLGTDIRHETLADLFGYKDTDDFLAAIGQGDINTQQIAAQIIEAEHTQNADSDVGAPYAPPAPQVSTGALSVLGTGGLLTNLGRCCHPLPGDPIIGYVTRGRGVTIHRQDCPNILRTSEQERLIDVNWGPAEQTYPVMVKITAYDRSGLLRDISAVIANQHVSMSSVSSSTQKNIATIYATLQVPSISQLSRVLTKLERLHNVLEVRRQTD